MGDINKRSLEDSGDENNKKLKSEIVNQLISDDETDDSEDEIVRLTPDEYELFYLVMKEDVDVEDFDRIKELINNGVNVNIREEDDSGYTLIMQASALKVVKLLVEKGADLTMLSKDGLMDVLIRFLDSMLIEAVPNQFDEYEEIVCYLLDNPQVIETFVNQRSLDEHPQQPEMPLLLAIEVYNGSESSDCTRIIRKLVQRGADINAQESDSGETALMVAVKNDALSVVEYLLGCKEINLNVQDKKGNVAFDHVKTLEIKNLFTSLTQGNDLLLLPLEENIFLSDETKVSGAEAELKE